MTELLSIFALLIVAAAFFYAVDKRLERFEKRMSQHFMDMQKCLVGQIDAIRNNLEKLN